MLYHDLAQVGEPGMTVLTDQELARLVRRVLSDDPRVDRREIDVRVEDGVVFLSGAVDSAAERRAAEEDVESTPARRIVNTLTLRNFVERTDEQLRTAVKRALCRDATLDASDVRVDARDGVVTLGGKVNSAAQKRAIEDVAWWTPGVIDVVSRLRVEGVPEPPDEPDY